MATAVMTDSEQRAPSAAGLGKGPRTKKPRRRRRMLTGVSRQRRAANARERKRIQGVNNAFVELKSHIPVEQPDDVSKIETLRLAAKWIAHLTTVLIQDDRKRGPGSQSPKSLPKTLQDKLHELLQFELEDFMLISDSLNVSLNMRGITCNSLTTNNLCKKSDKPNAADNGLKHVHESKSNESNYHSNSNVPVSANNPIQSGYTNSSSNSPNASHLLEGWHGTSRCGPADLCSSSSNSSNSGSSMGSCSPSDLQCLDSCEVSPHCFADDPLGMPPYDMDLPPLASVFSQHPHSAPAKNPWNYLGGQYDVPQAVPTGYYR